MYQLSTSLKLVGKHRCNFCRMLLLDDLCMFLSIPESGKVWHRVTSQRWLTIQICLEIILLLDVSCVQSLLSSRLQAVSRCSLLYKWKIFRSQTLPLMCSWGSKLGWTRLRAHESPHILLHEVLLEGCLFHHIKPETWGQVYLSGLVSHLRSSHQQSKMLAVIEVWAVECLKVPCAQTVPVHLTHYAPKLCIDCSRQQWQQKTSSWQNSHPDEQFWFEIGVTLSCIWSYFDMQTNSHSRLCGMITSWGTLYSHLEWRILLSKHAIMLQCIARNFYCLLQGFQMFGLLYHMFVSALNPHYVHVQPANVLQIYLCPIPVFASPCWLICTNELLLLRWSQWWLSCQNQSCFQISLLRSSAVPKVPGGQNPPSFTGCLETGYRTTIWSCVQSTFVILESRQLCFTNILEPPWNPKPNDCWWKAVFMTRAIQ